MAQNSSFDPAEPAYELQGVNKIFVSDEPVHALVDIDLTLREGSFTCIVGPSGCGKSTLLRVIGGLLDYTSGSVHSTLKSGSEPSSAFVFQEHGVFPWMNVLDNVAFGQRMAGASKRDRLKTAGDWVQRTGLSGFEEAYPHQLSGGMRQRVAIARAFATGSPALLMDEPLGALDSQTRTLMQEELVKLWEAERKTVVLVTHSIEEALLLGDQIVMMSSRPATIKEIIDVPFDRPRGIDTEQDPRFSEMKMQIWESIRDEVQESMGAIA